MALPPQTNEAFLREVDDAVRQDQLVDFWTRYGKAVIAVIVTGLIALAGWLWWQSTQNTVAGTQGEELSAVLDELGAGRTAGVDAKLKSLESARADGYRAAAKLTRAAMIAQQGNAKGAAAQFGAIAGDASLPQPYRDLALIRQTATEFDTLKPAQVVARLTPLAVQGGAFHGSAGEMIGVAQLRAGQPQRAIATFTAVANDEAVPQTIRRRLGQLAIAYAPASPALSGATPPTAPSKGSN